MNTDQPKKPARPLGATHIRTYLGDGKWRDDPIQPKPATGDQLDMVDAVAKYGIKKLGAATSEWTAETVQKFISYDFTLNWCAKVADAHNAELAAEREQLATLRELRELDQKALAAEREKCEKLMTDGISERNWSNHLRAQLVAEVEKVNKLQELLAAEREIQEAAVRASKHAIDELQKQLAAEREKVQMLVELLIQALRPEGSTVKWAQKANAALAKVK